MFELFFDYKYFIIFIILTISYFYMLNTYFFVEKEQENQVAADDFVRDKNMFQFMRDMTSKCGFIDFDKCFLAQEMIHSVMDEIKAKGLKKVLNDLNTDNRFRTITGEYVYIFTVNKDETQLKSGNVDVPYHLSDILDKKMTAISAVELEEKCGLGKCDIKKIVIQIDEFTRKNPEGGFIEYFWFDPLTQEVIMKRAYVYRMNNVEYKGEKIDLFLGSGFTQSRIDKKLDMMRLNIQYLNAIFLLFLFYFFNIDKMFSSVSISSVYMYVIFTLLTFLILNSLAYDAPKDEYIKNLQRNTETSDNLLKIGTYLIFFLFVVKSKELNTSYSAFFMIGLLITFFTTLRYNLDNTDMVTVKNILYMKKAFNISSAIVFITCYLIYLTHQLQTRKNIFKDNYHSNYNVYK